MLKKLIKTYYKLLDEKLANGTAIVIIITFLIVMIGFIAESDSTNSYYKTNVLESKSLNYIHIDGEKYKINFEKLN